MIPSGKAKASQWAFQTYPKSHRHRQSASISPTPKKTPPPRLASSRSMNLTRKRRRMACQTWGRFYRSRSFMKRSRSSWRPNFVWWVRKEFVRGEVGDTHLVSCLCIVEAVRNNMTQNLKPFCALPLFLFFRFHLLQKQIWPFHSFCESHNCCRYSKLKAWRGQCTCARKT